MREDTPPSSPRGELTPEHEIMDEEEMIYVGDLDEILEAEGAVSSSDSDEDIERPLPLRDDSTAVFLGHGGRSVFCGSLNPQNTLAVTGGEDDKAYVWDVQNGNIIWECKGFNDSVIAAEFSFDGVYLAAADMSGFVQVWRCTNETWNHIWEYAAGDLAWMSWHKGAHVLLAGARSGEVYIWKIPSGECKVLEGYGEASECASLMADGRRLSVGYSDGCVKLWDLRQGSILQNVIPGSAGSHHTGSITNIDSHGDNNLVITGGEDGISVLIGITAGRVLAALQCEETSIEAVAFCPQTDLNLAATGTLGGNISVWDISRNALRHKLVPDEGMSCVTRLKWAPDAKLLSAHLDGNVRLFDARAGILEKTLMGHSDGILDMFLSKDASILLTCADNGEARIFKFN